MTLSPLHEQSRVIVSFSLLVAAAQRFVFLLQLLKVEMLLTSFRWMDHDHTTLRACRRNMCSTTKSIRTPNLCELLSSTETLLTRPGAFDWRLLGKQRSFHKLFRWLYVWICASPIKALPLMFWSRIIL